MASRATEESWMIFKFKEALIEPNGARRWNVYFAGNPHLYTVTSAALNEEHLGEYWRVNRSLWHRIYDECKWRVPDVDTVPLRCLHVGELGAWDISSIFGALRLANRPALVVETRSFDMVVVFLESIYGTLCAEQCHDAVRGIRTLRESGVVWPHTLMRVMSWDTPFNRHWTLNATERSLFNPYPLPGMPRLIPSTDPDYFN